MQSTDPAERVVTRLRARLLAVLFLERAAMFTTIGAFALGTLVLAARAGFGWPFDPFSWGGLLFVPVLAASFLAARRRLPAPALLRARIDRASKAGGLVMAATEAPLGPWVSALPPLAVPRLRWRCARPLAVLSAAVVYLVVACVLPANPRASEGRGRLEVGSVVEELTRALDFLKEKGIASEELAETLREDLERIPKEARAEDPSRTWEAIDGARERLEELASKGAREIAATLRELRELEALADAFQEAGDSLDPRALAERAGEVARMSSQALSSQHLERKLDAEAAVLQRDLETLAEESASRSDAELERLRRRSQQALEDLARGAARGRAELEDLLRELERKRLVGAGLLEELSRRGQRDAGELARILRDRAAAGASCDARALREHLHGSAGDPPGEGGVGRGRADAGLTWKDRSSEEEVEFREVVLPPGAIDDPRGSRLVGQSDGAPPAGAGSSDAPPGTPQASLRGSGSAFESPVLPRHRPVVETYFERK